VSGDALDGDTIWKALQDADVVIQTPGVNFAPSLIFAAFAINVTRVYIG
jgi:hypothetical protein